MLQRNSTHQLTWNNITGIHGIFILNEAEAIHELDLGDLAGSMGLEMGLNVGLGGVAGEVPKIETGGGNFGHGGDEKYPRDKLPSLENGSELGTRKDGASRGMVIVKPNMMGRLPT